MCINLNWIKNYEIKHNFFCFRFFNFVRKFVTHKLPFYDHFWPFTANYSKIFHKADVQMVILRCFVQLYLNWIKSYNIKLVKNFFFMHYFKAILPKSDLAPPKETSSHIFKMAIFPKFFGAFMKHIIR